MRALNSFQFDFQLIFDFVKYPNAKRDRFKYNEVVNMCVNIKLLEKFNLSAFSTVEYCIRNDGMVRCV